MSENTWEIPQSFQGGMRVPGRVYADETLLEKMKLDRTLNQCANVAHLPGIYKWSITLPDGHEGYGFPIGGVAATDYEEGVVSPGGVGYDINCLSGETLILHELGFTLPIREFERVWTRQRIKCLGSGMTVRSTEISRFLKIPTDRKVLHVRTELGHTAIVTEDHPFLTPAGMVPLNRIREDWVAICPFRGVPYEEPENIVLVSERSIESLHIPCVKRYVINELRKRGLIPLTSNSEKLPYLLKIAGFVLGDGAIVFTCSAHAVSFFGKKEDLESIRKDVMRLGYTPSRIYSRHRVGKIATKYGLKTTKSTEHSFKVVGRSFPALLMALGIPSGPKASQAFTLPSWIFRLPLWQKRLFLASFFGAELSAPKTMTRHGRTFYAPIVSQNKRAQYVKSGLLFMGQIKKLLREFDVQTYPIAVEEEASFGKDGSPSARIRLQIAGTPDNLVRLWGRVGFEYNQKKSFLANVAISYLKKKMSIVEKREVIAKIAVGLRNDCVPVAEVFERLSSDEANPRFIRRSLYEPRDSPPRIPKNFPDFKTYLKAATKGLGRSGAVWDRILRIEEVPFKDYVYDFTVADPHHNFIANGFVVSNCGTRLLRTSLTESEVRPVLSRLLETLFNYIPSGLGSRGQIKVSQAELDKVLSDGVEWAIDKGYGWPEDAARSEEEGCMEAADPGKVSPTAKSRGAPQLGSLGSGNHFLEIEKVDAIFDERTAKAFGIEREGQVLVFIHTGSRGLGHQVCSDYLRVMDRAVSRYRIELPDRELSCAPGKSREAEDYIQAMASACNFAWANRQMITHWTREAFEKIFSRQAEDIGLHLIYDVAHNIAKIEEHQLDSGRGKVFVHRKGATRAFPLGHQGLPAAYREVGQPVLIPGSMGTASWVLVGTPRSMELSFGSTAHGAGRTLSRAAAKRRYWGEEVKRELEGRGVLVRAASMAVVSEEAPGAYKDVDRVAEVSHRLGIATKVARLTPIGVSKG
ncbi:intein-containing RctB family protein [Candidatus Bathyarchaeota archaeon]|nr:intein-containing RctB family protein [Candidatus Bathyarchaeota archaeon]